MLPQTASRAAHPVRRVLVAATALTAATAVQVALTDPAAAAADARLTTKLTSVMADSRVQRASSGAVVLDAVTGEPLYSRYGGTALIPASNTKTVTAMAALETLGEKYRFKTEVFRLGRVVDGAVQGRLYLKGYGDPTLRQSDFASLAKQVRAAGVTQVTGRLAVDASFFDSKRYNPGWSTSYAGQYYAAEVSALSVAPNADYDTGTVIVNYSPGTRGKKARITTTPAAAAKYVKISNRTVTSARGTRTTFSVGRSHGSNTVVVRGQVPAGRATGRALVTVHNPQLYAAAVFRAELTKVGVTVRGGTVALKTPAGTRRQLARDTSMTVGQLMVPFLKLSNNLHAEHLTKAMGARRTGRAGTWADGVAATRAYLTKVGTPMSGVALSDGSGLTRRNRLTARALATALHEARREPWFATFNQGLPQAGHPNRMVGGTMRSRLVGTRAAYNARAKTGSLTGVTSLSGYVTGADGRRYAFAMISNYTGSTPRPVENTLVATLAGWRR